MRVLQAATFVAAAMLLTGSAATAQSLGEAAAKEKEKRKGRPAPKVITEEELRQAGGTVSSPAAVPDGPAPVAAKPAAGKDGAKEGGKDGKAAPKEKTPDELRAEQEAAWRQRLADAEKEVAHNKGEVTRLQASLDDTTGGVYTPRRAGLQTSLEQAQRALADSQAKLAGIQEEGRRNSFR